MSARRETLIKHIIFGSDLKRSRRGGVKRNERSRVQDKAFNCTKDNRGKNTRIFHCTTITPYFLLSLSEYMSLVINITITLSNKTGEDPKVYGQMVYIA